MKAKDVLPGDVLTSLSGNLVVRNVQIKADEVTFQLAEGRTDPGFWSHPMHPDMQVLIYRPTAREDVNGIRERG